MQSVAVSTTLVPTGHPVGALQVVLVERLELCANAGTAKAAVPSSIARRPRIFAKLLVFGVFIGMSYFQQFIRGNGDKHPPI
jgi:hypothetical protein